MTNRAGFLSNSQSIGDTGISNDSNVTAVTLCLITSSGMRRHKRQLQDFSQESNTRDYFQEKQLKLDLKVSKYPKRERFLYQISLSQVSLFLFLPHRGEKHSQQHNRQTLHKLFERTLEGQTHERQIQSAGGQYQLKVSKSRWTGFSVVTGHVQ